MCNQQSKLEYNKYEQIKKAERFARRKPFNNSKIAAMNKKEHKTT